MIKPKIKIKAIGYEPANRMLTKKLEHHKVTEQQLL